MNHTYLGLPPVSHGMISTIVGNCHVSESILDVVRITLSKMKGGRKAALKSAKFSRRYAIAAAIQHHKENRIEYRQVMACSSVEFVPRYFWDKDASKVLIAPSVLPQDMAAPFTKTA